MKTRTTKETFYEDIADLREQGGYYLEKNIFFLKYAGEKKRILDIGCNDGFFAEKLKAAGHTVVGIDISKAMLAEAKKKGIDVYKVNVESEKIPFPDASFDIVILSDIIEHIFDTDRLLAECYRLLVSKGKLFISTPNVASLGRRCMLLLGISPYLEFSPHLSTNGLPSVGHIRYYTVKTLSEQLNYHNFSVNTIEGDLCVVGPFSMRSFAQKIPTFCRQLLVVAEKASNIEKPEWEKYFYSRYKPVEKEWGIQDLMLHRQWYQGWLDYILSKHPTDFKDKTVLEIGCGLGATSSLLSDMGAKVTATDVSPKMLSIASKLRPDIEFFYMDIRKKVSAKKTYDYMFGFEVLEHIDRLEDAGKTIFTLLNKTGVFIGTTPYPYKKNMSDKTHVNVHYPEFWKTYFKKLGFSSVEIYPLSCFPYLWRIHSKLNIILPFFTGTPLFVSTQLIIAKK